MSRPILSWLDSNLAALSKLVFNPGTDGTAQPIVADTESPVATIAIANNFTLGSAAADAVDDATDCYLKVVGPTDETALTAPVVTEKWISAKCTSAGQDVATRIGYDTISSKEITIDISAGDVSRPKTISGAANAGTKEDGEAKYNIAYVDLTCTPDSTTTATGGIQKMKFVLVYSYGAQE